MKLVGIIAGFIVGVLTPLLGTRASNRCAHVIGVHHCSEHQGFCHACYKCQIDFARHAGAECTNCALFLANAQPTDNYIPPIDPSIQRFPVPAEEDDR